MTKPYTAWLGALSVLVVAVVLVVLDLTDASVHRYWSRHAFTSSVVAGVLVLLQTVLIVDRVIRMREIRNQSRAIGAQAAVIVAQAKRVADAATQALSTDEARDDASDELRTYGQMLLASTPVLIDAAASRTFLEAAQRVAAYLYRVLRDSGDGRLEQAKAGLDAAVEQLVIAAVPLLAPLNQAQRAAVTSDEGESEG